MRERSEEELGNPLQIQVVKYFAYLFLLQVANLFVRFSNMYWQFFIRFSNKLTDAVKVTGLSAQKAYKKSHTCGQMWD